MSCSTPLPVDCQRPVSSLSDTILRTQSSAPAHSPSVHGPFYCLMDEPCAADQKIYVHPIVSLEACRRRLEDGEWLEPDGSPYPSH